MLKAKHSKAQSTLEYIVVFTAVVGLIIYAAVTWIKPGVEHSLENANATITGSSKLIGNITP
jgi:hypothetical protein